MIFKSSTCFGPLSFPKGELKNEMMAAAAETDRQEQKSKLRKQKGGVLANMLINYIGK
jgi:hypothetical protein